MNEEDFDENINPFENIKNPREKNQVYYKLLVSDVYVHDVERLKLL